MSPEEMKRSIHKFNAGKTLGDMPAHPCLTEIASVPLTTGLTKREYFAAMAMQGMLSNGDTYSPINGELYEQAVARVARTYADALLAELAKEQE